MLDKNIRRGGLVALTYLILGVLWILLTDEFAKLLVVDSVSLEDIQVYKGLFFVLVSAIVIYFVTTTLYRKLVARDAHIDTLLSHDGLVLMVTGSSGIVLTTSESAEKITGLNQNELRGTHFDRLFVTSEMDVQGLCAESIAEGHGEFTREANLIHRDGYQVPVRIRGTVKRNSAGSIVYCTLLLDDLREQRRLEDEQDRQARFIKTALFHLPIGVAVNRVETGETTLVNPKFAEVYGWPAEELADIEQFFRNVYPNEQYRNEVRSRIMDDISSGDPKRMAWSGIRITTKTGEERIVAAVNIPVPEQGLMISTVQDITESHYAKLLLQRGKDELERLNKDLLRSNKELEEFAFVASHDLQEPLRMVAQFTRLLEKRYSDHLDDDAKRYIAYAVEGAQRMQIMLNDLLQYSRVGSQSGGFERANLRVMVDRACDMLALKIEQSEASIEITGGEPEVKCIPSLIERLFINLIDNALKYRSIEPPHVNVHFEERENGQLITVRDNGIGIDPMFAERIFVIFQRLHKREEFQGTGIGLAVCKRIVERHQGRIWLKADDEQSKGACFQILLPLDEH